MYSAGRRIYHRRRWPIISTILVILVLVGAGIYAFHQFTAKTQTIIHNTLATTSREAAGTSSQTIHFEETNFQFDLPTGWEKLKISAGSYTKYSYQSSLKAADNRYLDIYVDDLPLAMAVNKAVAVRVMNNTLQHGNVSDNCLTYTSTPTGSVKSLKVPAKWDGIDFWCDNDTTTRNVVGTSSPDSINKVTIIGKTTGSHSFFFVYTDNNHNPDYTVFYTMLDSFMVR